jgi:nicotinate-nucleotide adenylyltransferase
VPRNAPIGILGGIFDPVHHGHLAAAQLARDYFHIDKIIFIPAGRPAHKSAPCANAEHRLAMLKLGIRSKPGFEIWQGELHRKGPSFTVDTLRELKKHYPSAPLYFIIGSDNLREIPLWRDFRAILKLALFCVAHRPGHSMRVPPVLVSMHMKPFPGPEWKLSSTMIREYVARGYSCESLLPPEVIGYIKRHALYSPSIY